MGSRSQQRLGTGDADLIVSFATNMSAEDSVDAGEILVDLATRGHDVGEAGDDGGTGPHSLLHADQSVDAGFEVGNEGGDFGEEGGEVAEEFALHERLPNKAV